MAELEKGHVQTEARNPGEPPKMVSWRVVCEGKLLVVALHRREQPSEDEWTAYLALFKQGFEMGFKLSDIRGLAITEGGAPSSLQRKKLLQIVPVATTAVVSDNVLVRGVATALSWFRYDIGVFPPQRLNDALEHLGIPVSSRSELLDQFRTKGRLLGRSPTIETLSL
jgi:hypothetical protein